MSTPSDEASIRVEFWIVDNNDAEKREDSLNASKVVSFRAAETFCKQAVEVVGQSDGRFTVNKYGLIVLMAPVDRAVRGAMFPALQSWVMHHSNNLIMAGHPAQIKMFDFMQEEFYWLHIGNDIYTTSDSCSACAQNRVKSKLK